jgi:hypothetical protein
MAGTRVYYYENTITVAVYALKSGAWTFVGRYSVDARLAPTTAGGVKSFPWNFSANVQLGSGVQAIGITYETALLGTATLETFSHVIWQAPASAQTTRSATPNGERTTVTVRPV